MGLAHNDNNNNIISTTAEYAANSILEIQSGIHALVVYSDRSKLRELWSVYTKKSIEEKNELVCLLPFYESVDSVRQILLQGHKPVDIQKYENEQKSLIIVDSLEKYYNVNNHEIFSVESLLKANDKLVEYAKAVKKKRVSILGDLGAFFFFKDNIQSLINYESSLPIEFKYNLKGICLYHQKDFDRLSIDQKNKIIGNHKIAIKI